MSEVMVNFTKITVSKLSKLQKIILNELREKPVCQEVLAHSVAHETDNNARKSLFGATIGDNFVHGDGEVGGIVLTNDFKASFYRSLRRLRKRRIIRRYCYHGTYEWGGHYRGTAVMIRPEALEILEAKGIFAIHSKSLRI